MKKTFFLLSMTLVSAGFAARLDTGFSDGFEKINYVIKGTDKHYMRHIQAGWQFTKGPLAYVPAGWRPNCGQDGIFMAVDLSEDESKKPYVRTGKGALRIGVVDGKGSVHVMRSKAIRPGRYRLTVWTKGTGKIRFGSYNYFDPGDRRIVSTNIGCETKPSADWVKTEKVVNCGADVKGAKSTTFAMCVSLGDVYIDDIELVPVDVKAAD